MASIDIFIKSFKGDFWLLDIALRTIKRNVINYNNLVLLIPEKDKHDFDTREMPERTLIFYVPDEGRGWLRQQYYKMIAHKYCTADFIMFTDSDCFWDHYVNIEHCVKDNKPEILYTAWQDVGDAVCWRKPTEDFLKEPVEYERMRRNQMIFHRSTLEGIEKFAPDLENMIMSSDKFSEFNAMAGYAYKYERDKYSFVNTADWSYVEPLAIQVWSHSSKKQGASPLHLREFIRLQEAVMKSFNVPVPNP